MMFCHICPISNHDTSWHMSENGQLNIICLLFFTLISVIGFNDRKALKVEKVKVRSVSCHSIEKMPFFDVLWLVARSFRCMSERSLGVHCTQGFSIWTAKTCKNKQGNLKREIRTESTYTLYSCTLYLPMNFWTPELPSCAKPNPRLIREIRLTSVWNCGLI